MLAQIQNRAALASLLAFAGITASGNVWLDWFFGVVWVLGWIGEAIRAKILERETGTTPSRAAALEALASAYNVDAVRIHRLLTSIGGTRAVTAAEPTEPT